jgi:hypothetical protein
MCGGEEHGRDGDGKGSYKGFIVLGALDWLELDFLNKILYFTSHNMIHEETCNASH